MSLDGGTFFQFVVRSFCFFYHFFSFFLSFFYYYSRPIDVCFSSRLRGKCRGMCRVRPYEFFNLDVLAMHSVV